MLVPQVDVGREYIRTHISIFFKKKSLKTRDSEKEFRHVRLQKKARVKQEGVGLLHEVDFVVHTSHNSDFVFC